VCPWATPAGAQPSGQQRDALVGDLVGRERAAGLVPAIQLSAPAMVKAAILGSHSAMLPSAMPCRMSSRKCASSRDLKLRSSRRRSGGRGSSPTRMMHIPKSCVTMAT
jgi:hypothetical protein